MGISEEVSSHSSKSPESAMPEDDGDTPEGFLEIENAFARVSLVADSLLDDIHDDSLRGKQRRRESRKQNKKNSATNYITDSDDDGDKELERARSNFTLDTTPSDNLHHSYENYGHDSHFDDVSTLGELTLGNDDDDESLDGSLVQDIGNLKSITRSMREEMSKSEEAFHANVISGNGKAFFQKLEESKAREDAKTPKVRNAKPPMLNIRQPTTISVRNGGSKVPLMIPILKPKQRSLWEQLQDFCPQFLGTHANVPLLAATIAIWLLFFRLTFSATDRLLDPRDGSLSSPMRLILES